MALVRVEVEYELADEIWITNDCLGRSFRFKRAEHDVEVRLPPFNQFDPASIKMGSLDFDGYAGCASGRINQPEFKLGIYKILIFVREEVEGISQSLMEGNETKEAAELISSHQRKCKKVAERVMIDFLDQIRNAGQAWLGSMGSISYTISHSATFDEDTGYRFKFGHGGVITARAHRAELTKKTLDEIATEVAASQPVPLPEAFLADAEYFLELGSTNKTASDLQRAVLLAAIACELKVRGTLTQKVFEGGRALVETLIGNPRDFSMSAAGLFDKAMKAAVGRSLLEDNRELYRAVADNGKKKDALFQNRNAIAHMGKWVTQETARSNVQAARHVFDWLDALPEVQRF